MVDHRGGGFRLSSPPLSICVSPFRSYTVSSFIALLYCLLIYRGDSILSICFSLFPSSLPALSLFLSTLCLSSRPQPPPYFCVSLPSAPITISFDSPPPPTPSLSSLPHPTSLSPPYSPLSPTLPCSLSSPPYPLSLTLTSFSLLSTPHPPSRLSPCLPASLRPSLSLSLRFAYLTLLLLHL